MEQAAVKLDEFLDEQVSQDVPVERFVIDNLSKAEWAVRKIASHQTKIKEAEDVAKERIEQIQAWLAGVKEENSKQIMFFEEMLRPFAEEKLEGQKKRSMKLPCGTIGFRKAQPKFERNESELLPWVKENSPEHVVVKESVSWTELKKVINVVDDKAISPDGEIIPGIVVEQQPDTFYVKVEG